MIRALVPPGFLAVAAIAGAAPLEVIPRVGADFEHFGETYRVTADRDTVTQVDDYGTVAGVLLRTPWREEDRIEVDTAIYAGHSTRRASARLELRRHRPGSLLEVRQEATYRAFTDAGDYALSTDHFRDRATASLERRLAGPWSFRVGDDFDGTWYADPDPYNLTQWTHEPRGEVRYDFGDFSRVRAGYRFARRDVPDSTSLGFDRHAGEVSLSWLAGETTSLDVTDTLERRRYEPGGVRESSRENRAEVRLEFAATDRLTCRIRHENETIRYDAPDDLDFDSDWARTGFQMEMHRTADLDLSVMPVYTFLASPDAAEEEYTETGLELGVDWRFGRHGWLAVTNEVGRRDYRVDAPEEEVDLESDALGDDVASTASSDYVYDRLTLILGAEPVPGVAVNLFLHWQPEDHAVASHDNETRIVSGGVTWSI